MSAYFIAVDLEGVALAVGSGPEAMGRGENYRTACRQAVREVNAAARALWEPVVIDGYALVLENPDPDGSGIPPDGVILLKDGRVHSVWGPLDPGPIRAYLETAAPT